MTDPMDSLRQASADVSGVELSEPWWQRAARERVEQKAEAILDAYCTLADLRNRSVSEPVPEQPRYDPCARAIADSPATGLLGNAT